MVVGHRLGVLGVLARSVYTVYGNLRSFNVRDKKALRQAKSKTKKQKGDERQ